MDFSIRNTIEAITFIKYIINNDSINIESSKVAGVSYTNFGAKNNFKIINLVMMK